MATRVELTSLKRKISSTGVFRRFPNPHRMIELHLWRAVIDRAILDVIEKGNDREDAELWFDVSDKDFCTVCELADLEPSFVVENTRKIFELFEEY